MDDLNDVNELANKYPEARPLIFTPGKRQSRTRQRRAAGILLDSRIFPSPAPMGRGHRPLF